MTKNIVWRKTIKTKKTKKRLTILGESDDFQYPTNFGKDLKEINIKKKILLFMVE